MFMNTFTVTTGNKKETELKEFTRLFALHDMWCRQYYNTVTSIFGKYRKIDDWSQDELMKAALCGVKYMNSVIEIEAVTHRVDNTYQTPFEAKQTAFKLIDALFGIIGRIKLKNLIKIFPIDKDYDGAKWECKDYFFTMDVLREKGLDNAIGRDGVFDLLWDYENRELRKVTVFYMSCMSAMYQRQTGVDRENGIIVNNQTGKIAKLSNKPSFMQIVK